MVGTFDYDVPGASTARTARCWSAAIDDSLGEHPAPPDLSVAANSPDSLSRMDQPAVGRRLTRRAISDDVEWTGSHAASIDALRDRPLPPRGDRRSHMGPSRSGRDCRSSVTVHASRACRWSRSGRRATSGRRTASSAALQPVSDPAMAAVCATLKIRELPRARSGRLRGTSALAELG